MKWQKVGREWHAEAKGFVFVAQEPYPEPEGNPSTWQDFHYMGWDAQRPIVIAYWLVHYYTGNRNGLGCVETAGRWRFTTTDGVEHIKPAWCELTPEHQKEISSNEGNQQENGWLNTVVDNDEEVSSDVQNAVDCLLEWLEDKHKV